MNQLLFELSPTQTLTVRLRGVLSDVALTTSALGQQQAQQTAFTTGNWLASPELWHAGASFYLHLVGERGELWLTIGGGQISQSSPPSGVPLTRIAPRTPSTADTPPPPTPMPPMAPMPPMPAMEMRMGNMSIAMGTAEAGLREENLRLREENLKLREEIFRLREQLQRLQGRP